MITAAIKSRLDADAAVNALLDGRLYPSELPQGVAMPAARYTLVSDVSDFHHSGATNLRLARVQIDVVSTSYDAAYDLARKIETSLAGFRGTMGSSPNQHEVQMIKCEGLEQMFSGELGPDDNPRGVHGVMADYLLWYLD